MLSDKMYALFSIHVIEFIELATVYPILKWIKCNNRAGTITFIIIYFIFMASKASAEPMPVYISKFGGTLEIPYKTNDEPEIRLTSGNIATTLMANGEVIPDPRRHVLLSAVEGISILLIKNVSLKDGGLLETTGNGGLDTANKQLASSFIYVAPPNWKFGQNHLSWDFIYESGPVVLHLSCYDNNGNDIEININNSSTHIYWPTYTFNPANCTTIINGINGNLTFRYYFKHQPDLSNNSTTTANKITKTTIKERRMTTIAIIDTNNETAGKQEISYNTKTTTIIASVFGGVLAVVLLILLIIYRKRVGLFVRTKLSQFRRPTSAPPDSTSSVRFSSSTQAVVIERAKPSEVQPLAAASTGDGASNNGSIDPPQPGPNGASNNGSILMIPMEHNRG